MESKKLRVIYSTALAKKLIGQGYIVRDIKPNDKDRKRTIFLFEDNEELEKVVNEFTTK